MKEGHKKSSLFHLQVVRKSAVCNTVQLVVDSSGDVIVPMYDWCSLFATTFKKLPSIKSTHHSRMSAAHPGKVFTKENCSSPEVEHCLLKERVVLDPEELPPVISPRGLPSQRQWYLYDKFGSSALPLTKTLRVLSRTLLIPTVGRGLQSLLHVNLTPSLQPPTSSQETQTVWELWPTWSQRKELSC